MTAPVRTPARPGLVSFLLRAILPIGIPAGLAFVLVRAATPGDPHDTTTLLGRIVVGAAATAVVLTGIAVLAWRVDRRPLRDVGLPPLPGAARALAVGVFAWFLPAGASFALLSVLGHPIAIGDDAGAALAIIGLVAAAVLLSEALPEELLFRGYLTGVLSERLGGWPTILTQAAVFTVVAVVLRGGAGIVDVGLFAGMGVGLGYLRMITGSVWTTVGFHTAFQTASQLVLSHDALVFDGDPALAMLALGPVPFAIGAVVVTVLATRYPATFGTAVARPKVPDAGRRH